MTTDTPAGAKAMLPTVQIGGTSLDRLTDANSAARDALDLLADAVSETAPNGRDYTRDSLADAAGLYAQRLALIQDMYEHLMDDAMHLADENDRVRGSMLALTKPR